MDASVRRLFGELVDIPHDQRERVLAQQPLPTGLRAEVESLLRYDSRPGSVLTRRVSAAVEELRPTRRPSPPHCGPYRLIRLLGSGGMGSVYLAERGDGEIEQQVAIKLLRGDADRPTWHDRFLRERQLLAYLHHSSIARLLDAGHTGDGQPYLVMEYVDGVTIDEYAAQLELDAQLFLFLRVCDGVSHAHRHLIIHRDLKPSNILVDSSGQPKLLDFGIAKLLDPVADQTKTVERLLTPQYASPEQLRGDVQTTATDVYSLGAVLYRLVTGRSPRELSRGASTASQELTGDTNITAPSQLNPRVPRDIDYILRKALRYEPSERYGSVDAFAEDIRAFLESRPVQARSGDTWYRARRFLRRYRVAVAAAAITLAGLSLGLMIANHQRAIAQRRFQQVRQLANKVLVLDQVAGGLQNSSKARHEIVAMSKEHLEALGADARTDQELALEIGEAYSLLARAQGIPVVTNLGQHSQAEESLRMAATFVAPILSADPSNRKALLTAARISHDRMILVELDGRRDESAGAARKAVGYLNQLLELKELSQAEYESASQFFYNIALAHKNLHLHDDGIRYAHRAIEISRHLPDGHLRTSMALSILADLLRLTGDTEGALETIREARANLEKVRFPSEMTRRESWLTLLWREGRIFGASSGINANRRGEAIAALESAFHLVEECAQNDPEDAWSRLYFASVGRELGHILRASDPEGAMSVYDHSLLRLGEVKNNAEARRGEVEILAGSAYALRRLGRIDEATQRINAAFRLLGETRDYPADRVIPHTAPDAAFRALGDHLAETGEPQEATKVYEVLLEKMMVSEPDPLHDLRDAVALSHIYGSLVALYLRGGERERSEVLAERRQKLWKHWDRKLPANGLMCRQIESARTY